MKKLLIALASVICFSSVVLGQKGVHEHDGFFLRMLYGFGYAELVEKDVLGSDLKFSGAAAAGRFQIGGTVSENLILYGEFGLILYTDPELEWTGYSASNSDFRIFTRDIGGGITYYLMPSNFYFSLSLLLSQASSGYDEVAGERNYWFGGETPHFSEYGFGLNAMVGKEWWVGNDWALGVALYGYYSTMKDKGTIEGTNYEYDINNFSIGVMFSATYN